MPCERIGNIILCYASTCEAIDENGKVWKWETDYSGCPWLHRKDGEISHHQPHLSDQHHPFWEVFEKSKETDNDNQ